MKPFISFETTKAYELFFISFFVGNPSASSLTIKELDLYNITKKDADKLIKVCSFFNPLFIISLFSVGIMINNKYAYLIIIVILFTNILISVFFNNKYIKPVKNNNESIIFKPEKILLSINDCLYLLIQVAGVMVFVNIIKFSLQNFINMIHLKSFLTDFILYNLEISTGAIDILNLNLRLDITIPLLTFLISFQGLSINLQTYNVIKPHYKLIPICLIRLLQATIGALLTYIIMLLI